MGCSSALLLTNSINKRCQSFFLPDLKVLKCGLHYAPHIAENHSIPRWINKKQTMAVSARMPWEAARTENLSCLLSPVSPEGQHACRSRTVTENKAAASEGCTQATWQWHTGATPLQSGTTLPPLITPVCSTSLRSSHEQDPQICLTKQPNHRAHMETHNLKSNHKCYIHKTEGLKRYWWFKVLNYHCNTIAIMTKFEKKGSIINTDDSNS